MTCKISREEENDELLKITLSVKCIKNTVVKQPWHEFHMTLLKDMQLEQHPNVIQPRPVAAAT